MGEINYEFEKKRYKKFYMHLVKSGIVKNPFDEDSYDEYIFDGFSGLLALEEIGTT